MFSTKIHAGIAARTPHCILALGQREDEAAELVEADIVIGAIGMLADVRLNLLVRGDNAKVVEGLVEVLDLLELKIAVVVDVKRVEELAELRLGDGEAANVVLQLLRGEVTVVVVSGDVAAAHDCDVSARWDSLGFVV